MAEFTPIPVEEEDTFVPQPIDEPIAGDSAFVPIEATDETTAGDIAKGLAAEVLIGEGAKYAGATAGAAIGSVVPLAGTAVGATIGYVGGALAGGVSGSIAAQKKFEGRDEISWGRVVADTVLNLLPGGLGKASKGTKLLPRLVKGTGIRAAEGATIGVGGAQIEKAIDEGEFLTLDELTTAATVGAGLGVGLGAAGEILKKSYPKFAGKSDSYLNAAYEKGDHDAIAVAETLAGEKAEGRGNRWMKMLMAKITPSTTLGRRGSEDVFKSIDEAKAALDTGSRLRKEIQRVTKDFTQEQKDALDDYVFGRRADIPPEAAAIKDLVDQGRDQIERYQLKLKDLYESGSIDVNDYVMQKINKSVNDKNYFTRDYQFYDNMDYVPSAQATAKLEARLAKDGMSPDEISAYLRDLELQRQGDTKVNILKGRKLDNSPELREYLGEYTDLGERMFGTISGLGRVVARNQADRRLRDSLLQTGQARVMSPEQARAEGLKVLKGYGKNGIQTDGKRVIRSAKKTRYQAPNGKVFDLVKDARKAGFTEKQLKKITTPAETTLVGREAVYVSPEVNQAIKEFANTRAAESPNIVANTLMKALSTTTAAAKFVRVPLNAASYPVQWIGNAVMVAGQGMNPFNNLRKGLGIARNELNGAGLRSGKFSLKEVNRLKELGIVDQGVLASDIRDGFKNGLLPKKAGQVTDFFGKLYNVFDTAQRISVFENYKGFLKKHIPAHQFSKLSKEQIEDMAAELTNSTYQNYGRVNKNLRQLSRYGILNEFASFNLEQVRTVFNQARLNKSMIDGSFVGEMKQRFDVDLDAGAIRKEGMKRTAALSSVLTAGSLGVTIANREGGTDEESEGFLRDYVFADWERDQALHITRDGNKISVANMSYQIPSAELTSVLEAGLRGDDFQSAAGNAIDSMWGKFGGDLTINLKNIVSAVQNRNVKTGDVISEEPGVLSRNLDLVKYYFAETFTPGTVRDLKKLDERSTMENTLRYTMGYRSRKVDIEEGIGYKLRNLNDNFESVRNGYRSALYKGASVDSAYEEQNAVYRRNAEIITDFVEKARDFHASNPDAGLTDEKLNALMTKARIPKAVRMAALEGEVGDMPIFVAQGAKTKEDKLRQYVNLSERMSYDMMTKMIQNDFDDKKLSRKDVRRIMLSLESRKVLPSK